MKQDLGISKRAGVVFQIRCVHLWRFIGALLVLALVACMPRAASAQVTVLVMPMEHPKDGVVPFGPEDYAKIHPKLRILNSDGEWQHLRIGYHRWLCNELNDVAAKLDSAASEDERKELVHLRFLSWDHALDNLTVTYKGKYDVCQVPSTWTAALIDKGILAPYDDFAPGDYPDRLLETCYRYGDRRYHAVPWHIDFRVIYYADRLTTNPDDLLEYKSFEQCLLRRQAQMRSSPDGRWEAPLALGITRNEWDILHNTFNWAFGGRIVERRGRQWIAVFAEAEPAAGVQRLLDLRTKGLIRFVEADKARQEQEWMTLARGLLEGKHDVVLGGPYMRVAFADRPDVKAARLPRMVERHDVTFLGGSHLGLTMAKRTPQQEQLARAIIERLTSKEAAISLYQNTDAMPARSDAFEQFLHENPRWAEAFLAARDAGKPYPSIPQWAEEVEVKLGPGLFHNTLASIAAGRDWKNEVLPNLTKAAEQLTEALHCPWWEKWAIAGGSVTIAMVVVVIIWLWQRSEGRARGAVKKSYELVEEAERAAAPTRVSELSISVNPDDPERLLINLSDNGVPFGEPARLDRRTSLVLMQTMREALTPVYFFTFVELNKRELDGMRKSLVTDTNEAISKVINDAVKNEAKEHGSRGPSELKVNIIASKQGLIYADLDTLGMVVTSELVHLADSLQGVQRHLVRQIGFDPLYLEPIEVILAQDAARKMAQECAKIVAADPGNLVAWHCLLELVRQVCDEDLVPGLEPPSPYKSILRMHLLRYMYGLKTYGQLMGNVEKLRVLGKEANKSQRAAKEARKWFTSRARAAATILEQFGWLQPGGPGDGWADQVADAMPIDLVWCNALFLNGDLESILSLAACSLSSLWVELSMDDWSAELKDTVMSTSWFERARTGYRQLLLKEKLKEMRPEARELYENFDETQLEADIEKEFGDAAKESVLGMVAEGLAEGWFPWLVLEQAARGSERGMVVAMASANGPTEDLAACIIARLLQAKDPGVSLKETLLPPEAIDRIMGSDEGIIEHSDE